MAQVTRLQHTSIPMPPDGHDRARAFYGVALGMTEKAPPPTLDTSKLVWFRASGDGDEIHLFVDPDVSVMSSRQHLCLVVDDLTGYRARLEANGVRIEETDPITNRPRFFVNDPFGNLVEIAQVTGLYEGEER